MPLRPATPWLAVAVILACDPGVLEEVEASRADAVELAEALTLDGDAAGIASEVVLAGVAATRLAAQGETTNHTANDACQSYCHAYDERCGDGGAFPDRAACIEACDAWVPGDDPSGDTLSCRAAFLVDGRTSCIAAGPSSPLCVDEAQGPSSAAA